ncbi:MAG TPA: aldolase/citrate lyase family protein [Baekduia sp.]|nr:aldolase/citrate lyase family protein [Baekduia sp.]
MASGLRHRLRTGEPLLGTFVKSHDPNVVEVLATAGYDVLVADLEHAPLELRDLHAIARVGALHGVATMVRIAPERIGEIGRILESGVSGIQVGGVADAETLSSMDRAVRFAPAGSRGLSTSHRGAAFGRISARAYVEGQADEVALVAQVENAAAIEALPSLLRDAHGPDAWFIGPVDLSCDLGHPGELDHPDVRAAIDAASSAVLAAGARLGSFAARERDAADCFERGVTFVVAGSDLSHLAQRADAVVRDWRRITDPEQEGS